MAGWMKAVLAVVALGAVGALAWTLGSDGSEAVDGKGPSLSLPAERQAEPMVLPQALQGEAKPLDSSTPRASQPGVGATAPNAPVAVEAQQAMPDPERVRLVGRLVDPAGRPIAGGRVVFHDPAEAIRFRPGEPQREAIQRPEVLTGADGSFALEVDVPGPDAEVEDLPRFLRNEPQVAAVHEAFATGFVNVPALHPGEIDLGTISLVPGTRVMGRVVDDVGRAIEGAKVSGRSLVDRPSGQGGMLRMMRGFDGEEYSRATTGPDGRFVVSGLSSGKAEVSAQADGRQVAVLEDVELEASVPHDVGDIVLQAGAAIAGWVVDELGAPVVDASVRVSSMARIVIRRLEDVPRQQLGHEMGLRALTDANGYFELAGLGVGQYTVHVTSDGFAREDLENVATGTRDLRVVVHRLGRLEVTVRSQVDDSPVNDARIEARPIGTEPWLPFGEPLAVLGPQDEGGSGQPGVSIVEGAGPTGTRLVIAADGFALSQSEAPSVPSGGRGEIVVRLVPESIIAGHVLDEAGRGIPDARVDISAYEPPTQAESGFGRTMRREVNHRIVGGPETNLLEEALRTRTDASGRFELRGVAAGDWEIRAQADDHVPSEAELLSLEQGQSQEDVEIRLQVGGSIAGHVVEERGTPVAGADVIVRPQVSRADRADGLEEHVLGLFGGEDGSRRATTAVDGSFEVGSLAPGVYEVELARPHGMTLGRAMVFVSDGAAGSGDPDRIQLATVTAGQETTVHLVRPPTATLEGRVVAGGEPVEAVLVSLSEAGSFLPFGGRTATTDDSGRYLFEDVEPGKYEVSSIVDGAALPETVEVELAAGQGSKADLVFGGATLSGRVVDADSERGVPDVTIVVTPARESTGRSEPRAQMSFQIVAVTDGGGGGGGMSMDIGGGPQSKVRTDAEGRFAVRFLKPGKYSIETQGGGYPTTPAGPVDVDDGQSLDDLEIEVERGASITGIVRSGSTGDPLDGAPVSLSSENDRSMTMTEGGRYRFEGLEPGDYTLSVMGSGFGGEPLVSEAVHLAKGEAANLDLVTRD